MAIQSARSDGDTRRPRPGLRDSVTSNGLTRYRLDVVAVDAADAARHAGGWLFDRAMAGWEVNVLVADARDVRPMQILGARVLGVQAGLDAVVAGPDRAAGLAVSATALGDDRVCDGVLDLLRTGGTEVALWGGQWPDRFGGADAVAYRMSSAARIFKAQALLAAGVDGHVDTVERLQRGGYRPIDSDLMPVG